MNIGKHVLIECSGEIATLGEEALNSLLTRAAEAAGATILSSNFHLFGKGCGVTGVLVLAESHITVHTWPENNYAAFDVFMCGDCDPTVAARIIADDIRVKHSEMNIIARGIQSQISRATD